MTFYLEISADRWRHDVVEDKGADSNVAGDYKPLAVEFLTLNPDVDGKRCQITAHRYHNIRQ